VTLPSTYPKIELILSITNNDDLREKVPDKSQKVIEMKPKKLLAEEQIMIMEIVNDCLELLSDTLRRHQYGTG